VVTEIVKWMGIVMVALGIVVWTLIIVANLIKDIPDKDQEQDEHDDEDQ